LLKVGNLRREPSKGIGEGRHLGLLRIVMLSDAEHRRGVVRQLISLLEHVAVEHRDALIQGRQQRPQFCHLLCSRHHLRLHYRWEESCSDALAVT
jgi:hypothetical protein